MRWEGVHSLKDTRERSELLWTLSSSLDIRNPPDLGVLQGKILRASPALGPAAAPPEALETAEPGPRGSLTLRHPGWMISLQMEHSMSMRLNLPSSSSTVSSFPASPHTRHTAVWGSTGWKAGESRSQQGPEPQGNGISATSGSRACQETAENWPGTMTHPCIQSPLCARYCSKCWEYSNE